MQGTKIAGQQQHGSKCKRAMTKMRHRQLCYDVAITLSVFYDGWKSRVGGEEGARTTAEQYFQVVDSLVDVSMPTANSHTDKCTQKLLSRQKQNNFKILSLPSLQPPTYITHQRRVVILFPAQIAQMAKAPLKRSRLHAQYHAAAQRYPTNAFCFYVCLCCPWLKKKPHIMKRQCLLRMLTRRVKRKCAETSSRKSD